MYHFSISEDGELLNVSGSGGEAIIPEGVTSIGEFAFEGCINMTSAVIPESVTSIGKYAFEGCTSLTSIVIPESVTSIGESIFHGCTSLTSITIPESITSIGKYAFEGTSLTSITIPESVTSIGEYAFVGCINLKSIVIPDSVTSIKAYAFAGCTSLTSIVIPDSVTSIGECAFADCSSLTDITIPDSVTNIGICAFADCTSLRSIVIPDSVTSIGAHISDCPNLKIAYHGLTFSSEININAVDDIMNKKDISDFIMTTREKHITLWFMFCTYPQNEMVLAHIKKNFQGMFKFLIDRNDIQTIQKVLDSGKFVTKKEIDEFIQYAIDKQNYEAQVMLTNHKTENGWYEDSETAIKKKFRL